MEDALRFGERRPNERSRFSRSPHERPAISIVIPVYNEEAILARGRHRSARAPRAARAGATRSSSPRTARATAPSRSPPSSPQATPRSGLSHRRAQLRQAPEARHPRVARGDIVICDEIDLCDTEFYARAWRCSSRRKRPGDRIEAARLGSQRRAPPRAPRREPALQRPAARLARLPRHRHPRPQGLRARAAAPRRARAAWSTTTSSPASSCIRADRGRRARPEIPVASSRSARRRSTSFKRVPNVLRSVAKLTWAIRVRG